MAKFHGALHNGLHVRFWEDRWLGNTTLKDSYPGLYQIASNQKANVGQYREGNNWTPLFRRNLQDWEINDLLSLLEVMGGCSTSESQTDKMLWGRSKEGKFTVKDGYNHLCSQHCMLED